MDSNVKLFILDLIEDCSSKGVTLYLAAGSNHIILSDDIPCSGYFSDDTDGEVPELAIAVGGTINEWLPVLVHESCHLDQWFEKSPYWTTGENDAVGLVDGWLLGKDLSPDELINAFRITKDLELDCEKRVIEKIKKYELPIDIDNYIRKANSYLMFYNYCMKWRKWNTPNFSIYSDAISSKMPNTWFDSYDELPEYIEEVFETEFKKHN